ncbi:protein kinase-like domain, concanavalin A-like lectin/glucanase domain protein [Tanacetum coccineum]
MVPFKYPYYNGTDTRCGLIKVNCYSDYAEIQLGNQSYRIGKIDYESTLNIYNNTFAKLVKNESCDALMSNFTSPEPLLYSISIAPFITLFKCAKNVTYFDQPKYNSHTRCNDYNFYYQYMINNATIPSDIPHSCQVIQLPVQQWEFDNEGPAARNLPWVKLLLALGVGIAIILISIILCLKRKFGWRKKTEFNANVEIFLKNQAFMAPRRYFYSQIKKITNTFKVKLGQGGFGSMYKGELSIRNLVVVKVLSQLKGDVKDFVNEVASVGRTSHVNIVNLVGFCLEGRQRALIYEFMPNGSLENFIYGLGPSSNSHLGWKKLHQIAIGIARGLEYLHSGCNTRILHFDIKPHNILLDKDLCPKITDFGLAKLFPNERSKISMSHMRGTPGYIAPELFSRNFGQVSNKSDVYSYGMMILEMFAGRKDIDVEVDHSSEMYFPHWIYKRIEFNEEQLGLHGIVSDEENNMIRKTIIVGLWCIQTNPLNRPTITRVLEMLEDDLASIEIPPKPYMSSPSRHIAGWRSIVIFLSGFVFIIMLFSVIFIIWRRHKTNTFSNISSKDNTESIEDRSLFYGVSVFSYTELEYATQHFDPSNKLGDGGFGVVYYGKLKDGREVAVKKLYEHNYRRVQQFINEVEILTKLRHPNLVVLYGCTSRQSHELLVYEYIPNGTVSDHLHGKQANRSLLTWPIRMNIAIQTASALVYLHANEIIHRDVKTNNILLDHNFCVKVADFGLSRLIPNNVTHVSTAPQGTPGYVDPQYHQCYQLTDKSDVYSFGVVLSELISSMVAVDLNRSKEEINLANLALNRIQRSAVDELIDPVLVTDSNDELVTMITSVAELAFRCLQYDSEMRPTMSEVLDVLMDIQAEGRQDADDLRPSSETNDIVVLLKNFPPSPVSVTGEWQSENSASTTEKQQLDALNQCQLPQMYRGSLDNLSAPVQTPEALLTVDTI